MRNVLRKFRLIISQHSCNIQVKVKNAIQNVYEEEIMKRIMLFILTVVIFLCVFAGCVAENADRCYAEEQCRRLLREYDEAVAKGDKTGADRAAAMYNDYIFSYSAVWEDSPPEKLNDYR